MAVGHWAQCIHSQEAQSGECWYSARFLPLLLTSFHILLPWNGADHTPGLNTTLRPQCTKVIVVLSPVVPLRSYKHSLFSALK